MQHEAKNLAEIDLFERTTNSYLTHSTPPIDAPDQAPVNHESERSCVDASNLRGNAVCSLVSEHGQSPRHNIEESRNCLSVRKCASQGRLALKGDGGTDAQVCNASTETSQQ
ncbi:hypothetical protein TSAR_003662 [Trichomalopsis sarcophagae]|uniref:Uncharacterized protein n=1 Tax=Trichomalopsis sarcophagae TaxID=543379 RepID=A0A232EFT7_9HYME|nr:hypothetical protein TSAR_003662 [Trichomalopsis sarcophagae]